MKPRHLLIGLLIAATVCLDLVIVTLGRHQSAPTITMLAGSGFALGQTTLASIWLVWGRRNVLIRFAGASGVVTLAAWVSNCVNDGFNLSLFLVWHVIFLAIVASALITARRFHVRLVANDRESGDDSAQMPWQYTLGQLLSWVTAVAIALGAGLRFWQPQIDVAGVFAAVLPFAIVAIVAVFGAFQRQTTLSMLLLLLATPFLAVVPAWLEGKWSVAMWQDGFVVSVVLTAYVAGVVAVLRSGGLRLRSTASKGPTLVAVASPHAGP